MHVSDGVVQGGPGREKLLRRSLARASLFFAVLLLANLATVALLLFRDLDRQAIVDAIRAAETEALKLAEGIGRVGAPDGAFDYFRIFEREQVLTRVVNEFLARQQVIHHIEVRDASGNTVMRMARGETKMVTAPEGMPFGFAPQGPEGPQPTGPGNFLWETPVRERLVGVPVPGGPAGATLEVSMNEDALESEAREVRRALMIKLVVGAAISLVLLVAAFLYVLRLVRRTRRLEADAHMADRLAYVGTLASGLAHEIRNPLNAMSMNLQMLEEELGEEGAETEALSLLTASRSEVHRLEQLVQDFLAYARPGDVAKEVQHPARVLEDVVSFLRPQFDEAGVELTLEAGDGVPRVALAVDPFRQALINVIQNALQASPRGRAVIIRLQPGPDHGARVEVEDDGPGIPPDRVSKIFEVFYSERPGGSGLGLPIAQRILEAHGGRVEVDSQMGRGTIIRFVLPPASRAGGESDDGADTASTAEGEP